MDAAPVNMESMHWQLLPQCVGRLHEVWQRRDLSVLSCGR